MRERRQVNCGLSAIRLLKERLRTTREASLSKIGAGSAERKLLLSSMVWRSLKSS